MDAGHALSAIGGALFLKVVDWIAAAVRRRSERDDNAAEKRLVTIEASLKAFGDAFVTLDRTTTQQLATMRTEIAVYGAQRAASATVVDALREEIADMRARIVEQGETMAAILTSLEVLRKQTPLPPAGERPPIPRPRVPPHDPPPGARPRAPSKPGA